MNVYNFRLRVRSVSAFVMTEVDTSRLKTAVGGYGYYLMSH